MPIQDQPDLIRSKLMSAASLFEGEFNIDWLVELTGLKAHQILAELQDEIDRKSLKSPNPGIYTFRSEKKRSSLINSLDPSEKNDLHRRVIDLLERDLPEDDSKWRKLGRHLLFTDNDIRRCRLLSRAGDVHRKTFQTEQAFQCYTKVLEDLKDQTGEEANRLFTETAVKYSKISTARHDTARVLSTLNNALARAGQDDNQPVQALLEMHIAKNEWMRANYDQALAHFENGWIMAKELDDSQVTDSITAFGTFFLYWQGRFREAVESNEKTVSEVEDYPLARFPLLGSITVGYCYAQIGRHTQGLGMLDGIRTHCLERGDYYLACQALGNIGEIMLDLRRLDEALSFMEQAAQMAQDSHNRWCWLFSRIFLAFAYHLKGDNRRAVSLLKEFLNYSREFQATVLPYPYLLALLWAARQGRFPKVKGLTVEGEVERMISSPNIYMQGLGRRYQAILLDEEGASEERVIEAHEDSIRLLDESGHQVALARSRLELARFLLSRGKKDRARELSVQASRILSSFDEALVPDDLRSLVDRESGSDQLLQEILQLGQELVKIRDRRELVQRIISTGNSVTGAERGAIFMWEENETGSPALKLRASRNLTTAQVEHPYFSSSLKMIEETARTGRDLIAETDAGDEAAFVADGVIRSKICVPMTLHDQVVGVLYHDNRLLSSAFKEADLGILSYFAALAAIAMDNARAYEEINRLNLKLSQEKEYLEEEHLSFLHFDEIVGQSKAISKVLARIEQVAGTETSVLITGETGVGKELVARAIHRFGARSDRPFISVQLSTLPEELIASELLGHEKGAFTGASRKRVGRFELADGGTLFLDEIGDISPDIQVRLLRVLQTREFERIGGTKTLHSDFRLIAATNRDLVNEVREGRFRADLYYRLNVFPIYVPPLRERKQDIPLLAFHFLKIHAAQLMKNVTHIPEREMKKLTAYNWPGNVRELQNIIERGVILSSGPDFRMPELEPAASAPVEMDDSITLAENERRHILRVLERAGWRVAGKQGAADILGVPPSTLAFRMKKLGINRPDRRDI